MSGSVWRSGRVEGLGPYLFLDLISSPLSVLPPSLAIKACAQGRFRQSEPQKRPTLTLELPNQRPQASPRLFPILPFLIYRMGIS